MAEDQAADSRTTGMTLVVFLTHGRAEGCCPLGDSWRGVWLGQTMVLIVVVFPGMSAPSMT